MDLEFIALIITLLGGFAGNYALVWDLKDKINKNTLEFAKCPMHCKEGLKND